MSNQDQTFATDFPVHAGGIGFSVRRFQRTVRLGLKSLWFAPVALPAYGVGHCIRGLLRNRHACHWRGSQP